jgi:hypothetical protein
MRDELLTGMQTLHGVRVAGEAVSPNIREAAIIASMELNEAIDKAKMILQQEEKEPTINYRFTSGGWPDELKWDSTLKSQGYSPAMAGIVALQQMRKRAPREVYESPNEWQLKSVNYSLLMAIFSQLSEHNRGLFVGGLLNVWTRRNGGNRIAQHLYPAWNGHTSASSLLAEFSVRNGHLQILLDVLNNIDMPTASIAVLFVQLSEMISLNFDLFSDEELASMPGALKNLRDISYRQTRETMRPRGTAGPVERNKHYKAGFKLVGNAILEAIDAFLIQCDKARYWYLKGALQQLRNPEIESDRTKVIGYLERLGFSQDMRNSLNAAEKSYRDESDGFELKACLGHLRSFLEQLHIQACIPIAASICDPSPPQKWGSATLYLRNNGVLSLKEEQFIAALYTLGSDEAVHPLVAEREYARLLRNVIIEYGLLFLTVVDNKVFRINS